MRLSFHYAIYTVFSLSLNTFHNCITGEDRLIYDIVSNLIFTHHIERTRITFNFTNYNPLNCDPLESIPLSYSQRSANIELYEILFKMSP